MDLTYSHSLRRGRGIVVAHSGRDLIEHKLSLVDRMLSNTCGFTSRMMHVVSDTLKDPELLADFPDMKLIQFKSLGQHYIMTQDAYEAAAFHHEVKDAAEMARTEIISCVFALDSVAKMHAGSEITASSIPDDEEKITNVLRSYRISDEKLKDMIVEISQRFVMEHDSEIPDNKQISTLAEEVISEHMSYVDYCMAEDKNV